MSHFETLIHAALQQPFLPIDQQDTDAIIFELNGEKQRMLEALHSYTDEKTMEYYVKARQHQLVRLMNLVMETNDDICKQIFKSLEDLLSFLEINFPRYLDENCLLPDTHLRKAQEILVDEITLVGYRIATLDEQLKSIVMIPFKRLLLENEHTYHELYYLQKLLHELYEVLTETVAIEDLQILLLEFDFNDPAYFSYLIEIIQQNINDAISIKEKKEKIFRYQKYFNQISVHPGMCLEKLYQPLKEQLQFWLAAELRYLDNYEKLLADGYLPGELDVWKGFKIQTNLSILQLGRLIGLMLTSGVILNQNKKELARFFSVFFTSVHSDVLTEDSIRNSFYNKSRGLAKSICDILSNLIKASRE